MSTQSGPGQVWANTALPAAGAPLQARSILAVDPASLRGRVRATRIAEGEALVRAVEEALRPVAAKFETLALHWVGGGDESESFCRPCCERQVAELLAEEPDGDFHVDGGWGGQSEDSQAFCGRCETALECSYTAYCCKEELVHFAEYGFDATCPNDCHSFIEIAATVWSDDERLCLRLIALAQKIAPQVGVAVPIRK